MLALGAPWKLESLLHRDRARGEVEAIPWTEKIGVMPMEEMRRNDESIVRCGEHTQWMVEANREKKEEGSVKSSIIDHRQLGQRI